MISEKRRLVIHSTKRGIVLKTDSLELSHGLCWRISKLTNSESENVSHSLVSHSFWPYELEPARLLCSQNFPGKNIGVGCHSFLRGIFLTQGMSLCLLHWRQILYLLSHQGSCKQIQSYMLNVRTWIHTSDMDVHLESFPEGKVPGGKVELSLDWWKKITQGHDIVSCTLYILSHLIFI